MRVTLRSGRPIDITTVAERPGQSGNYDAGPWGEFMRHNRISDAYFGQVNQAFPEVCLTATTEDGTVVADGHAVRFASTAPGRDELPDGGWEQAVVWAFSDARRGTAPDTACALNISVAMWLQGDGLAGHMLVAMRAAVAGAGSRTLLAPVRPTRKDVEPATPMVEYAARVRDDGLPYDPWLRTHVRVGGRIVGVAKTSWVIADSLDSWRTWTGLPFDRDGPVEVTGALVPVWCDTRAGHAVYVEPNIWIRHDVA